MSPSISFAITVKDEIRELKRLVEKLQEYKKEYDEVVIVYDSTEKDILVMEYLRTLINVNIFPYEFNHNFSDLKNFMNLQCFGNWIFQIDADELPDDTLLLNLHEIVEANKDIDVIWVPRINVVYGITPEHIVNWKWEVNSDGWINWPHDAQCRLYKNRPSIHWVNNVHEKLVGYKTYSKLPDEKEFSLWHIKDIDRQERQNSFYERILDEI